MVCCHWANFAAYIFRLVSVSLNKSSIHFSIFLQVGLPFLLKLAANICNNAGTILNNRSLNILSLNLVHSKHQYRADFLSWTRMEILYYMYVTIVHPDQSSSRRLSSLRCEAFDKSFLMNSILSPNSFVP